MQFKHKIYNLVVGLLPLFLIQTSFAYYCSTSSGSGYINIGDSMAEVKSNCGAPTSVQISEVKDQSFSTTEYWLYNRTQVSNSIPLGIEQPDARVTAGKTFSFAISNSKVKSISVNGNSVQSTKNCGRPINIGTDADTVLSLCGKPSNTNVENTPSDNKVKVTTLVYDQGEYQNTLKLEFIDDQLKTISE